MKTTQINRWLLSSANFARSSFGCRFVFAWSLFPIKKITFTKCACHDERLCINFHECKRNIRTPSVIVFLTSCSYWDFRYSGSTLFDPSWVQRFPIPRFCVKIIGHWWRQMFCQSLLVLTPFTVSVLHSAFPFDVHSYRWHCERWVSQKIVFIGTGWWIGSIGINTWKKKTFFST